MRDMRRQAHALLAAGDHDVGVAGRDLLGAEGDGAQARAAHLVHAQGRGLDRNAGGDRRLPRRVLALAGRQHLTHDHFIDIGRVDLGALQRGLDGDLAERMRRQARQRAVEGANRRPRRADDDNLFLFHTSLQLPQGAQGHNVVIPSMEAYGWDPVKARGKASGAAHKERATDFAVAA